MVEEVTGSIKNQFIKRAGDTWWLNNVQENFDQSTPHLTPGVYKIMLLGNNGPIAYIPVGVKDELVHFKEGIVGEILAKTNTFFSEKTTQAYKDLKVAQQIGMILYGPPGTGKSCTALVAMDQMVAKYGTVCLDCTGMRMNVIQMAVKELRANQPEVPLVIFVDEFDDAVDIEESRWLTMLDGTNSVDRCVFIACTNYLKKIPARIKHRKSRVKYLFEVKHLPDSVYRDFVSKKMPKLDPGIWAKFAYLACENALTLDELKHAVIDYYVDGTDIELACKGATKEVEVGKPAIQGKEDDFEDDDDDEDYK